MQYKVFIIIAVFITSLSIALFPKYGEDQTTFIDLRTDKEATMAKYAEVWDTVDIKEMPNPNIEYEMGDVIGKITIPGLNIYEQPIYYGSDFINNNWQITAPGHIGNWGIPGEKKPTCIGSHNYQLFHDLPSLNIGDKFIIENDYDVYVYEVIDTDVYDHLIDDWNNKVFNSKSDYVVELMTCYPISVVETDDMYIVTAQMVKGTKFID